jgi:hypothetical protein
MIIILTELLIFPCLNKIMQDQLDQVCIFCLTPKHAALRKRYERKSTIIQCWLILYPFKTPTCRSVFLATSKNAAATTPSCCNMAGLPVSPPSRIL